MHCLNSMSTRLLFELFIVSVCMSSKKITAFLPN